jgi:hypothetical protein
MCQPAACSGVLTNRTQGWRARFRLAPNNRTRSFDRWQRTEATVKAKLRNILNGTIEIEREDVVVFSERPGTSASVSLKWE